MVNNFDYKINSKSKNNSTKSQRQLRVGEELRHLISNALLRESFYDQIIENNTITVTEVNVRLPVAKSASDSIVSTLEAIDTILLDVVPSPGELRSKILMPTTNVLNSESLVHVSVFAVLSFEITDIVICLYFAISLASLIVIKIILVNCKSPCYCNDVCSSFIKTYSASESCSAQ